MDLEVDGRRLSRAGISNYTQTLDMQRASLTTTFGHAGKVSVKHGAGPASPAAMIDVEITARRAGCFYRCFPAARSTIAYT